MKATEKLWKLKSHTNTLKSLEDKIYNYEIDINIVTSMLKDMRLMNKKLNIHQLKSNMNKITDFKNHIDWFEKSLDEIYELYTLFLEEEIHENKIA